jgi:hypothetical protein
MPLQDLLAAGHGGNAARMRSPGISCTPPPPLRVRTGLTRQRGLYPDAYLPGGMAMPFGPSKEDMGPRDEVQASIMASATSTASGRGKSTSAPEEGSCWVSGSYTHMGV